MFGLSSIPPDVYRRDFTNGIALLNGTQQSQTIAVGPGFHRLTGTQAPLHEYIVDDASPQFSTNRSVARRAVRQRHVEGLRSLLPQLGPRLS